MNEFRYFIEIVPECRPCFKNSTFGFFWEDDIIRDIQLGELEKQFENCIIKFEEYIFTFNSNDRTTIAEKTIRELIEAYTKAEKHRVTLEAHTSKEINTERIKLEIVFHNGINKLMIDLQKLNITYSDEFIKWLNTMSENVYYCVGNIEYEANRFWLRALLTILDNHAGQTKFKQRFIINQKVIACKHFPYILEESKVIDLMKKLIKGKFIAADTKECFFLYWFGCLGEEPKNLKPITWIENVQLARELLVGLFNRKIKVVEIEELAQICFFKNNKPMKLAKNKKVDSLKSDEIADFLRLL